MPGLNAEMLERLKARNEATGAELRASISSRWGDTDWAIRFPWWREPPEVRILIYADGDNNFSDLAHVRTLLETNPFPFVRFKVTTAHRDEVQGDRPLARLTDLNLDDFDELWLFGFNGAPALPEEERELVERFMAAPKNGGVLVTGDHRPLGRALGEIIPRVGAMRRWDLEAFGPDRNSSLEQGPDPNMSFNAQDEADDRPQTIHYTRFPIGAPAGVRLMPHPVLSGLDGPIDVLPDHDHEGEAMAPLVNAQNLATWPSSQAGHQEQPVVIAFGHVKDPDVHFKQFGVISVYDGHTVGLGRIIADSSWHHWLNSNLRGFEPTPQGQAALKKFDNYFLNCGAWLAPPEMQNAMRLTAWWSVVWTDETVQIPPDAPMTVFGAQATKQLRNFASACAVSEWVLGSDIFNKGLFNSALVQVSERISLFNLSVEQHLAGGILKALMREVGPHHPEKKFPTEAPADELLETAIVNGTTEALADIEAQLDSETLSIRAAVARHRATILASVENVSGNSITI